MDGWTKNLLKCTKSHSSGDIGEIVIFSQKDSICKGYGGQISEHTVERYFWVFNLVESKNSLVYFLGSKDFIGIYKGRLLLVWTKLFFWFPDPSFSGVSLDGVILCNTTMPDGTINNTSCKN